MNMNKVYRIYKLNNYFSHDELLQVIDYDFNTLEDAEKHLAEVKINDYSYVILTVYI